MSRHWIKETAKAKGLHKRDRAVLRELADVANKDGTLWWKQETLAGNLGMSERTVRTALKNLAETGWIRRDRRWKANGSRTSDLITLRSFEDAMAWAVANADQLAPAPAPEPIPAEAERQADIPARYPVSTSTRQRPQMRAFSAQNDPRPVEKIHQELTMRLQGESLDPPSAWPADGSGSAIGRKVGEP